MRVFNWNESTRVKDKIWLPRIMIEQGISTPTGFELMSCPKHRGEYQFI